RRQGAVEHVHRIGEAAPAHPLNERDEIPTLATASAVPDTLGCVDREAIGAGTTHHTGTNEFAAGTPQLQAEQMRDIGSCGAFYVGNSDHRMNTPRSRNIGRCGSRPSSR